MPERVRIDARNSFCPGPLMELIATIKTVAIGDEIEVWSADKGSADDIPLWLEKVGHQLVGVTKHDAYLSIIARKAK